MWVLELFPGTFVARKVNRGRAQHMTISTIVMSISRTTTVVVVVVVVAVEVFMRLIPLIAER